MKTLQVAYDSLEAAGAEPTWLTAEVKAGDDDDRGGGGQTIMVVRVRRSALVGIEGPEGRSSGIVRQQLLNLAGAVV